MGQDEELQANLVATGWVHSITQPAILGSSLVSM